LDEIINFIIVSVVSQIISSAIGCFLKLQIGISRFKDEIKFFRTEYNPFHRNDCCKSGRHFEGFKTLAMQYICDHNTKAAFSITLKRTILY